MTAKNYRVWLSSHFRPVVRNDAMVHDSYSCQKYWNTQPFPTQRLNNVTSNFVGSVVSKAQKVPKACPVQCRPYNHQNWKFCWINFDFPWLLFVNDNEIMYSRERKYRHPYYISPIEIGLLWAKIKYLKSHSKALSFDLQIDMK